MTSASTAKSTASSAISGLTYIDTLVTTAAAKGLFFIIVDGTYMNDTMAQSLITTSGYVVTRMTDLMGSFPSYKIAWA